MDIRLNEKLRILSYNTSISTSGAPSTSRPKATVRDMFFLYMMIFLVFSEKWQFLMIYNVAKLTQKCFYFLRINTQKYVYLIFIFQNIACEKCSIFFKYHYFSSILV